MSEEADKRPSITGEVELMGGYIQVSVTGNPDETSEDVLDTFKKSVDKMGESVEDVPEVDEEDRGRSMVQ